MAKLLVTILWMIAALSVADGSAAAVGYVRFDLRHPGVYRVYGRELAAAGVRLDTVDLEKLSVICDGVPVPVLVKADPDGRLNPDSSLEFVGDSPRGTTTWFRANNKYNVYLLRWDGAGGPHYTERVAAPADDEAAQQHFWQWRHFEKDYQHWFSTLSPDMTDNFFWFPFFAGNDPEQALQTNLVFPGIDSKLNKPVQLELRIFGATNAVGLRPSHRFSFLYNMKPVSEIQFDGIGLHDARFLIPPNQVSNKPARISFSAPEDRRQAVDKIYLDWINARYPSRYEGGDSEFYQFNNDLLPTKESTETLHVRGLAEKATVFDPARRVAWRLLIGQTDVALPNADSLTTYTATAPLARMKVDRVSCASIEEITQLPADLHALVVYHPAVAKTAEAYTRYRREQGWKIEAVSVRSIFDQLNNGFIDDDVLKTYLRQVRERAPELSHIVLMGDAYFDYREARSHGMEEQLDVLIPIHWVYRPGIAWTGGYQDDNWYGSFDNSYRPDVAVGRIPINNDSEGLEYLRKIIEHEMLRQNADDGGLMISSVEQRFQSYVKEIGGLAAEKLSTTTYLFPTSKTASGEVGNLAAGINLGAQLLYYVGHGGSMVWRVGPEDFSLQKDLFTPADVKQLTNHGHYPVVVCASCYTTAFDQPESIGEAFVKQPGAGAIAVIGAPWKATVQEGHEFNRRFFRHYFDPAVKTIGEASLRAHRDHIPAEQSVPSENAFVLLGDPCLEIVRGEQRTVESAGQTSAGQTGMTSSVFRVEHGEVVLVGYDGAEGYGAGDTGDTSGRTKAKVLLAAQDFLEAKVYRAQVLLPEGEVASREFQVPEDATTITLVAAARAAVEVFPRVRVSLVGERSYVLYDGYWQTRVLERGKWAVPRSMRGQTARIRIEVLNPSIAEEERMFYLQRVTVE